MEPTDKALMLAVRDGDAEPIIQQLLQKYPESVNFEFRHFPLTKVHRNALAAAMAAEAAGQQGKFWVMHDLLLASQKNWSRNPDIELVFMDMARELGLDAGVFRESLRSTETEQRILKQAKEAQDFGIEGAPAFFINGRRVEQAPDNLQGFDDLVIEELEFLKLRRSEGR